MINTVKRASTRSSQLDYAKRKVKAPTLAPLGYSAVNLPKPVDYTKQRSIGLISNNGPMTLEKLGAPTGQPKKINTRIKW